MRSGVTVSGDGAAYGTRETIERPPLDRPDLSRRRSSTDAEPPVGRSLDLKSVRGRWLSTRGEEPSQLLLQAGVEEAGVVDDQHRGEHAERIAFEIVTVDRAKRRGDHRQRGRRGGAQIVETTGFIPSAAKICAMSRNSAGVPTRTAACRSAVTRSTPSRPDTSDPLAATTEVLTERQTATSFA